MIVYRFSGELRIRITYREAWAHFGKRRDARHDGTYRCYIAPRDIGAVLGATIYVRLPAYLPQAVDAPETIDGIARAALAFAADEGWPVDTYAASNETDYLITRKEVRR